MKNQNPALDLQRLTTSRSKQVKDESSSSSSSSSSITNSSFSIFC